MSDDGNVISLHNPDEVDPPCEVEPPCETVGMTTTFPGPVTDRKPDMVNAPPHYKQGDIEAIEIIEHVVRGYSNPLLAGHVWQVLKYVIRAPFKGTTKQDLKKANWYLRRAIEHAE